MFLVNGMKQNCTGHPENLYLGANQQGLDPFGRREGRPGAGLKISKWVTE